MAEFAEVVRRRRMTRAFAPTPVDAGRPRTTRRPRFASAERRQGAGLAPRGARGRRDRSVLGDHVARRAARLVPLAATAERARHRPAVRRLEGLHRPLRRARQGADRPRCRPRGVAGAVLDDRRVDVGDDDAVGRGGRRSGRVVLRRVPRRAGTASAPRDPTRALVLLGAMAIGHPAPPGGDDTDPGRSADRRRRSPSEIIHRGRWEGSRSPTAPVDP